MACIEPNEDRHSEADFFLYDDYPGVNYTEILRSIHKLLKPKRYFEIGTQAGASLSLAECASLAVDPAFVIDRDVVGKKPTCILHQLPSDAFFADYDPKVLLGGPIDLAFLDGMHWFEYLLRDFINTERHVQGNSVIVLHDCIPTDSHIARRLVHDDALASLSLILVGGPAMSGRPLLS